MGRRGYPPEFRRRVLDLLASGRRVTDLARDLGVSDQTVYLWRAQDRIDRGLVPGLTSVERAELTAAKRRIRELEAELEIHRPGLRVAGGAQRPKRRFAAIEVMAAEGCSGPARLSGAQGVRVRLVCRAAQDVGNRLAGPFRLSPVEPTTDSCR